MLEGSPSIEIEGETAATAAGMLIPSAAGRLHNIRNESDRVARVLVVKTPNPSA